MLEIDDLHVRYGRITAVRGVSFRIDEGEVVGLVGPNGAGKTTIMSAVSGLLTPQRGTVTFGGRSIVGKAPEAIVRDGIALVPEARRIFTTMTVADNLRLGATIRTDRAVIREDTERLLEIFPALRRYYDGMAGLMSGGEQQQLAIARAMLSRPRLLLLDEPSLGLAPVVVDLLFDAMANLREDGVTILLVEQVVDRTTEFADRTHVLRNGEIVLTGTREELAGTNLASAYLGVRS
jgi:branched-chain amino acid transport system ATP-binding protein